MKTGDVFGIGTVVYNPVFGSRLQIMVSGRCHGCVMVTVVVVFRL